MEASRSVPKRPGAPQKSPGMSQSTLQRAPSTLQNVPKRPRMSDWVFANGLQDIRDFSGKFLQRTRMPECLHMARPSRASHSSMLPLIFVKIIPMTSIANGVTVAVLSICVPSWLLRLGVCVTAVASFGPILAIYSICLRVTWLASCILSGRLYFVPRTVQHFHAPC